MSRKIGLRTAAIVLAVSGVVGVGFTIGSIQYQQEQERAEVNRQVETLLDAISGTASAACFVSDKQLASETLAGLGGTRIIHRAAIRTREGVMAVAGGRSMPSNPVITRAVNSPFSKTETVCQIEVELNDSHLRQRRFDVASRTAAMQGLQVLAVAIAVLLAVAMAVTRPIRRISLELHRIEGRPGGAVAIPPGHEHDELGSLVVDTNRLIDGMSRLITSERHLRELRERDEQRLRLIIENAETGIFTLDAEARMESWNPACVRVLGGPTRHDAHPTLEELLPELAAQIAALRQRVFERERSASGDFELRDAIGVSRWIQLVLTPSGEGTMQGLANDITDRKRAEAEAQELAVTDNLTGVLNRLGFERALKDRVASHARDRQDGFTIAMIDLDWFKQVNDTYGHDAGDHVLRTVSARLKRGLRRTDTLARLGGDEFVIVLDGVTDEATAVTILHKIRNTVLEPIELDGGAIAHVGASIGLTIANDELCGAEELLRRADVAMYEVKKAGRNDVRVTSFPHAANETSHRSPADSRTI
ncbi:diguanylate cyclase [Niveibacterium umoris]|uniref:diguanylate cyclase n=1 Tax=Niveibacterium umoris TaxID=1193620 RepID=UPI00160AB4A3|nr:diguanylate cyclase [Niveibacterium umoris]